MQYIDNNAETIVPKFLSVRTQLPIVLLFLNFTPTFALYFSFLFPNCAIILIPESIGKALNMSCYIVRVSGGYSARSHYILTSILHDIIISKHVLLSPFGSLLFVVTHFVSF